MKCPDSTQYLKIFFVFFLMFSRKPQISQFNIFDVIKVPICIFADVTKKKIKAR